MSKITNDGLAQDAL